MSRTNDKLESVIDEDGNVDKKSDEPIDDSVKSVDNTFKEIFQEISDSLVRLSGNSKDVKQLAKKLFTEKEKEEQSASRELIRPYQQSSSPLSPLQAS